MVPVATAKAECSSTHLAARRFVNESANSFLKHCHISASMPEISMETPAPAVTNRF
jgi:hypothetical protein